MRVLRSLVVAVVGSSSSRSLGGAGRRPGWAGGGQQHLRAHRAAAEPGQRRPGNVGRAEASGVRGDDRLRRRPGRSDRGAARVHAKRGRGRRRPCSRTRDHQNVDDPSRHRGNVAASPQQHTPFFGGSFRCRRGAIRMAAPRGAGWDRAVAAADVRVDAARPWKAPRLRYALAPGMNRPRALVNGPFAD